MNDEQSEIILDILTHISIQIDELCQLAYMRTTGKPDWKPRDFYTIITENETDLQTDPK